MSLGGARRARRAGRCGRARAARASPRRAPGRARGAAAVDLRRRRARQDDHHGHDRLRRRPASGSTRPGSSAATSPSWAGTPARGGGDLLVAEADESDGSAALLRPQRRRGHERRPRPPRPLRVGRRGRAALRRLGRAACRPTAPSSSATACPSRPPAPVARFGFDPGADWHITGLPRPARTDRGSGSSVPGEPPVDVHLKVPGAHNARNAAGALAALAAAGASTPDAAAALAEFTGVGRRFELRGTVAGATVVDDYAHNPAKVAAVIDAARTYAPARVVVCFQPHLYSRTAASAYAFGRRARRRRRGGGDRDLRRPRAPGGRGHRQAGRRRRVRAAAGHAARLHAAARRRGRIPARADARRRPRPHCICRCTRSTAIMSS